MFHRAGLSPENASISDSLSGPKPQDSLPLPTLAQSRSLTYPEIFSNNLPNSQENMLLCITFTYTYLTVPTPSESNPGRLLYTTGDEYMWSDLHLETESVKEVVGINKPFNVKFCHNLAALRLQVEVINAEPTNNVVAILNEDQLLENTITVTLSGPPKLVTAARTKLLQKFFLLDRAVVNIEPTLLFNTESLSGLNDELLNYLDGIASFTNTSISITDFIDKVSYGLSYRQAFEETNFDQQFYMLIYGDTDSANFAATRVKLVLEELRGQFIDSISIPLSIQPLICGYKGLMLKNIMKESQCKIFLPNWLPELLSEQIPSEGQKSRNLDEIYISGPSQYHVLLAGVLIKEIRQKTEIHFKDCIASFAKIDNLITKYQHKIKAIMNKNGAFIQFPYLGASRSLIRVQASSATYVEQTIRDIMLLTTELYTADYWAHTGKVHEDGFMVRSIHEGTETSFRLFIEKITAATNVVISVIAGSSFEVTGLGSDVKRAIDMLRNMPLWNDRAFHQVKYRIELGSDQRESIAGKRNGKVNKIMSTTQCLIKFLPFNEYNFYVDLTAADYDSSQNGLKALEDEEPAETSFYIPETFHKQVIGTGGQTIQTLMRKYNVFIKFYHWYEHAPRSYAHTRIANVLIKTPKKNSKFIAAAKEELMGIVNERSHEHLTTYIHISQSHRRILLAENVDFINEIERKTNTCVMFPELEEDTAVSNDLITIRGLFSTSEDAAQLIKSLLPVDYEFKIAHSVKFHEFISESNLEFFRKIIVPFRTVLKIHLQVFFNEPSSDDETYRPRHHRIILSFSRSKSTGLEDAIQSLTAYLREKDLDIIDRGEINIDPIERGSAFIYQQEQDQQKQKEIIRDSYDHRSKRTNINPGGKPFGQFDNVRKTYSTGLSGGFLPGRNPAS